MSNIETFHTEEQAYAARDDYNHTLGRRAAVFKLPDVPVVDYGGGSYTAIFNGGLTTTVWVLVVED